MQRKNHESEVRFDDPWPIRVHNPYVGAGFYGASGGILPFAWASAHTDATLEPGATVPHDRIQILSVSDVNPFLSTLHLARKETTDEVTASGGNIRGEPFQIAYGVEQKNGVGMIFPGRVTWDRVPVPASVSRLELFVAEHSRVEFMEGPGAIVRVRLNGQVAFETTIDSRRVESDRHWFPVAVDLSAFQGAEVDITFESVAAPWPDRPADATGPAPTYVGFAEPRLR